MEETHQPFLRHFDRKFKIVFPLVAKARYDQCLQEAFFVENTPPPCHVFRSEGSGKDCEEIRCWGHHIQNIERPRELGNVAFLENFFYLELLAQLTQVTSLAVVFFYSAIND